ncbi:HAMP domain-containing protein [Aquibacillus halophilus]|uniref:HAMP domain-containing protein n=1 Tax=Aquibacillus halophilus TaxID=930132 RepID=A0A6A8D859_9BACI|nr:sensor histidine kinase [Aquibacillus halophilus]MRH41945.1 HAMP domain-containing protein [Aquibacillus halophilus]
MNLKKWIFFSLRTKMLVMFVILTVTPLIFVGIVSYVKSYNIVSEKSHTLAQLKTDQLSRDIDILFQDIKRFTEIGEQANTVQFLINQDDTADEANTILNTLQFYRESYPSSDRIFDISISNNNGKVISESRGVYLLEEPPSQSPEIRQLMDDPTKVLFEPVVRNGFPAISMTTTILGDQTNKTIGFIKILIDASAIKTILDQGLIGDSGSFHIESETGEVLFHSPNIEEAIPKTDWNKIGEKSNGYYTDSTSTFFVFTTSEMTGWKIIGHAPENEIMRDANEIRSLIILSVTCSIIFTIGLYFFISSKLIRPIRTLKEKMKQASAGDFDVKVLNNNGLDEISELGTSFNSMIIKIKSLLHKSIDEQKQLKAAEFRAMQAQVNPHFLYNTLDTIIWMAEAKNTSQVIDVTKALSQFFRISLSKGKDWITLDEELEHIRNYLIIQKIRYEDILEVTFHINEDILEYKILKLALQPLIENAIYHGIKNKRGKGFIRIKGDINAQGHIVIDIIDNGIGITESRLDEIRTQLSRGIPLSSGSGGFGMVNVQQRIRLYYNEPFGLTINSWYRSGTHICLTIPAER